MAGTQLERGARTMWERLGGWGLATVGKLLARWSSRTTLLLILLLRVKIGHQPRSFTVQNTTGNCAADVQNFEPEKSFKKFLVCKNIPKIIQIANVVFNVLNSFRIIITDFVTATAAWWACILVNTTDYLCLDSSEKESCPPGPTLCFLSHILQ